MSLSSSVDSLLNQLRADLETLRARIVALEAENRALRAAEPAPRPADPEAVPDLPAELRRLRGENDRLRAENDRLRRGRKHSANSSKPPASDHPHDPKSERQAKPKAPPSGRKRGGQPGHPGTTRALVPVEEVQEVVACVPTACARCHSAFPDAPGQPQPDPIREQVWELPPIIWEILEYQRHARTCTSCGHRTWGERPPDAPTGCLGFRGQAAVGVLTGGAQLTRRRAQTLLHELLGLPVGLGTLSRVEGSLSAALAPAETEVAAAVGAAPVVNCDETPWREPGKKPWLWVATTPTASLFRISDRRDGATFAKLLPPRPGQIKGTDRYIVYISGIPVEEHAVCWAHLTRDFQAWVERPNVAGTIARWLAEQTGKLFQHWHTFRRGECDRPALGKLLEPVQAAVATALLWGEASGIAQFTGMCRNLLDRWEALWTFARVEGVEPTNNAAERAVRQGVLWRKVSLFTQSERGRTYVSRMLTVKTSLRQQNGNLLEFLTESLRAQRTGLPAPKLLSPTSA